MVINIRQKRMLCDKNVGRNKAECDSFANFCGSSDMMIYPLLLIVLLIERYPYLCAFFQYLWQIKNWSTSCLRCSKLRRERSKPPCYYINNFAVDRCIHNKFLFLKNTLPSFCSVFAAWCHFLLI